MLVLVQALLADTFSAIAGVTSYGGSWRKDAVNQCLSFYLRIQILQGVRFVSTPVSQTDREVSAGFTHFQWWKRNKKLMSLSRKFTSNRLWSWLVQIRNTLRDKKRHLSQLKLTQRHWHTECGHLFWIKLTTKQGGTENVVIYFGSNWPQRQRGTENFGSNWPQSNVAQRMWSSILDRGTENVVISILDQIDHKATSHRECGHLSWLKWTTKTVRHRAIRDNKDSLAQRPKRTTKTVWHRGTRLPFRWGLFLLRRRTPFLQSLHSQGPLENTEWHKSS